MKRVTLQHLRRYDWSHNRHAEVVVKHAVEKFARNQETADTFAYVAVKGLMMALEAAIACDSQLGGLNRDVEAMKFRRNIESVVNEILRSRYGQQLLELV